MRVCLGHNAKVVMMIFFTAMSFVLFATVFTSRVYRGRLLNEQAKLTLTPSVAHLNDNDNDDDHAPEWKEDVEKSEAEWDSDDDEDYEEKEEGENTLEVKYRAYKCSDSSSEGRHVVVTSLLVSESREYLMGALVLGRALQNQIKWMSQAASSSSPSSTAAAQVDMILMVLDDFSLSNTTSANLAKVGWRVCRVPLIESGFQEKVLPRFQKIFAKAAPFTWTQYERFIFMDLDTLPVGNLSDLFFPPSSSSSSKNTSCGFNAAFDYEAGNFKGHFNSGVFASCPSLKTFDFFMNFIKTREDYRIIMGDQGVLNKLADLKVFRVDPISWDYNANLAIFESNKKLWDSHGQGQIKIIHFTTAKPFNYLKDPKALQRTWAPVQLWFEQYELLNKELSLT